MADKTVVKLKNPKARAAIRALDKGLRAGLPAAAENARFFGQDHALRGLFLNVYGTEPGAYERTFFLASQIYSSLQVSATTVTVTLGDKADYAEKIEYGDPASVSDVDILARLNGMPPGSDLSYGRSGVKWRLPGPYITPAILAAQYKLHAEVEALVKRLWA